jgi:hypothetical protein
MIISASRRTDIPALYSKWFLTDWMLTGYSVGNEIVTDRTTESQKINQLLLF